MKTNGADHTSIGNHCTDVGARGGTKLVVKPNSLKSRTKKTKAPIAILKSSERMVPSPAKQNVKPQRPLREKNSLIPGLSEPQATADQGGNDQSLFEAQTIGVIADIVETWKRRI